MATLQLVALFCALLTCISAARPWLGTWHAWTDKQPENLNAFLAALRLPPRNQSPSTPLGELPILTITQTGQEFSITFEIPDKNFKLAQTFILDQEGLHREPKFLNNAQMKYTYTEDGDKLKATIRIPSINKVIRDTYEVVPGQRGPELVKTFEVDGIKGKQYFRDISNDFRFDFKK